MIGLVAVRSALISRIKGIQKLLTYHPNFPLEIRELNWQGQDFSYPCVRVGQIVLTPKNTTCSLASVEGFIFAFSELPSSLEAEQIADIIFEDLQGNSFSVSGTHFTRFFCQRMEAVRIEESGVWQSTIKWTSLAS